MLDLLAIDTLMVTASLGSTASAAGEARRAFIAMPPLAMSIIADHLFGRAIPAWIRARSRHHHDLKEV
jgi:hypothetical protein